MSDTTFSIPSIIADGQLAPADRRHLPEIVIYEHRHWQGGSFRTNLDVPWVGAWWNDRISGIIIVSGTWAFYEHRDFGGVQWKLGVGYYEFLPDFGISNDAISSFKCVGI